MGIPAAVLRTQLMGLTNFIGTHKDQADKYRQLLKSVLSNTGPELIDTLKLFVEAIVNEHVSLVIARQILNDVGVELSKLPDDMSKQLSHFTLEKVHPRVISFEEQVAGIRFHLANIYERNQQWRDAATVLVGIPLETGQKQYSVECKLGTYLKIARLYLEDNDSVQAELFINRASLLQAETNSEELQVILALSSIHLPNNVIYYLFLRFFIKFAMPAFLTTVVNSLRLLSVTTNSPIAKSWIRASE